MTEEAGSNITIDAPTPSPQRIGHVRSTLTELAERLTKDHVEMGCLLWEVEQNEYFRDWGYDTFFEYVEGELDFKRRKAEYLRKIYSRLVVELGVEKHRLVDLKWTKAVEVAKVADEKNIDRWMVRAKETSFSQLQREVREVVRESGKTDPGPQPSSSDREPLADEKERYEVRSYALYPAQRRNVDRAFEIAAGTAKSEKPGHLLDMICLEFLAGRSDLSDDPVAEIQRWVDNMKKRFPETTVLAFRGGKAELKKRLQMMLEELDSES